VNRFIKNTTS